jgi:hypothetical protein
MRNYPVRFSNGKNKMAAKLAAILFLPFEIWTNIWISNGRESLDRFINKSQKNLFMPKWSRLTKEKSPVGF